MHIHMHTHILRQHVHVHVHVHVHAEETCALKYICRRMRFGHRHCTCSAPPINLRVLVVSKPTQLSMLPIGLPAAFVGCTPNETVIIEPELSKHAEQELELAPPALSLGMGMAAIVGVYSPTYVTLRRLSEALSGAAREAKSTP